VKATALLRAPAEKGLDYQVAISIRFWRWRVDSGKPDAVPGAAALSDGLSGDLGGRIDVFAVVCAGQNLFRQQIVGITFIRRCSAWLASYFIMHDTPDARLRRRGTAGDRGLYLVNRPELSRVGRSCPDPNVPA